MKKKRVRKHDIFYQYLFTYFAVLFIPLAICSVYCIRMLNIIGKDDILACEAELKHSAALVENMLDEISNMGNLLVSNPQVSEFQYKQDVYQYPYSYGINKLQRGLTKVYQTNQSVFDYFLFFNQSEMVINPNAAYDYEDFYHLYLRGDSYGDYESWYRSIKDCPPGYGLQPMEGYTWKEKQSINLLVYIHPLLYTRDNSALRIYFQDTDLEKLLPLKSDGTIQYIENEQGQLVYYNSDLTEIDYPSIRESVNRIRWENESMKDRKVRVGKKEYFAVQYRSEGSGLIFYVLQPETIVNGRRISNAVTLMLLIVLAGTIGMAISYWMAKRTTTPISDILKEVSHMTKGSQEHPPAFSLLKATFQELLRTNSTLKEAIERQKPYIRNTFLNRLIYGDIISEAEAKQIADSLELEMGEMVFVILIFRFEMGEDFLWNQDGGLMSSYAISLMEILEKVLPQSLYTNLGEDQVILLFGVPKEKRKQLREEANQKTLQIRKELPADVAEKIVVYGGKRGGLPDPASRIL